MVFFFPLFLNTHSWVCFWTLFSKSLSIYQSILFPMVNNHSSFTMYWSLIKLSPAHCVRLYNALAIAFPYEFYNRLVNFQTNTHPHKPVRIFTGILLNLSVNLRIRSSFLHSLCLFSISIYFKPWSSYILHWFFFKLLLILFHCLEHLSLALVLLDLIGYCIECFKVYFMFIAAL